MKPIRLIELFSGVGAQASALERLKVDFEHYKTSEWEVNAVASYNAIHMKDNTDYSKNLTTSEIADYLNAKGCSTDGKNPLLEEQIKRKGESWLRQTYNNYRATHNIGSVVSAKGKDLKIEDTDRFTYLLTYSFPCQDLSVAGRQKGMSKGEGTRSGLLWEVERLLKECDELPQVLLMENVPQVHGKKFMEDFISWCRVLENLGYTNYWQDLNAKDYGVAQNRNRCFMVSFLGGYKFEFPKPQPLEVTMADYLEDDVDEKYYINNEKAQKLIDTLMKDDSTLVTDRQTDRQTVDLSINEPKSIECANCIMARYDSGISNFKSGGTGVLEL